MPASFIPLVPPIVANLHQEGLLERAFHDPLVPALQFRALAAREEADANIGSSIFMTRRGLLPVVTEPVRAGQTEPQPQTLGYEQWEARLERYWGTIDTSLIQNAMAIATTLGSNLAALGTQAGMSINRIARNSLYKPYCGGHTVTVDAAGSTDRKVHVASLNGFRFVVIRQKNVQPKEVSSTYPLPVTINSTIKLNVIEAVPDSVDDPDGPGTLTLSDVLGANIGARVSVLAGNRPRMLRAGGGTNIDAIGSGDILTVQDVINAVTVLRDNLVPPHEDGFYHCQLPNLGNAQFFQDPVFQRLHTALPDSERYRDAFIGQFGGVRFFANTVCPDVTNSGATVATGNNALYSREIGAETVNEDGVCIGRAIITGRAAIYERWFDAKKHLVSEAGMTGQQGDFNVSVGGIQIDTEGMRLVIRSPIDRVMDMVAATWDVITCFPAPSDIAAGGPEHYKRAVELEFALV